MTNKIQVIQQAIRTAGQAVKNAVPSSGVIQKEGRANIVTAADLASEKILMDAIKTNFPGEEILSEETTSTITDPLKVEKLWVIDPIDGTNNFRFERNYSAVSVGYVENGVPQFGVVYDPFRDELFFAQKGKGAFLNEQKISIGKSSDLAKATVATDNSYDPAGTKYNLELALRLPVTPWILMKGSAVLTMCDVACDRIDLYYHTSVKPWDNAAAFLIVEEAGGVIKDYDGSTPTFLTQNFVMGNEELVHQFLTGVARK